jgi:hypothetical protein
LTVWLKATPICNIRPCNIRPVPKTQPAAILPATHFDELPLPAARLTIAAYLRYENNISEFTMIFIASELYARVHLDFGYPINKGGE